MRKIYLTASTLVLASCLYSLLRAEPEKSRGFPDRQQMEQRRAEHERNMLERLTKKLNLTDDQQKSVKTLLDKQSDQMRSIGQEGMERRKAVHEQTHAEIEKLLSKDQKKEFEAWKAERKEHFKKRLEERAEHNGNEPHGEPQ